MSLNELLRALPGVDALLGDPVLVAAASRHGRRLVVAELRRALEGLRGRVRDGSGPGEAAGVAAAAARLAADVASRLDAWADGRLRPVINATGVLVHTNLGRAPLGAPAVARLAERAGGALDLEVDLASGRRGGRGRGVHELLVELTGAEAALVVNNCAAALMLSLNALARGRSVIVSRGELVEIGGSFRLPEICEAAGVRLAEVGTTNRTRLADYERRVEGLGRDGAGLLLKVHPSNFRLVGFTQEAGLAELVSLGRRTGVPVVMDQGSGALEDLAAFGVTGEPPVPALVEAGADLVLFSGDKLLGGPQAGCLVGRRVAIAACRQSPLYRVLRPGRLTLLALEATLWSHATGRVEEVPVQAMLRMPAGEVGRRAAAVRAAVVGRSGDAVRLAVVDGASTSGGGSSPGSEIPTRLLGVAGPDPDRLARALRTGRVPVVARIEDDAVMLDLRTVPPERDGDVVEALVAAVASVR